MFELFPLNDLFCLIFSINVLHDLIAIRHLLVVVLFETGVALPRVNLNILARAGGLLGETASAHVHAASLHTHLHLCVFVWRGARLSGHAVGG